MGDKEQFMGTVPIKVIRSVAAPGAKTHKKGGKGEVPKKLTTNVLPKRGERRPGDRRPVAPPPIPLGPGVGVVKNGPDLFPIGSHTKAHRKAQAKERKLRPKKPRTAKQKAATAANFKIMMRKASRRRSGKQ